MKYCGLSHPVLLPLLGSSDHPTASNHSPAPSSSMSSQLPAYFQASPNSALLSPFIPWTKPFTLSSLQGLLPPFLAILRGITLPSELQMWLLT